MNGARRGAAARAIPGWAGRTAYERSAYLYRAYRIMTERAEALARTMTLEQGKPLRAARNEVRYAADFPLCYAEEAKRVYTNSLSRAMRSFEGLRFGIIGVNDINPTAAAAPFGGAKESGLGREGGREGIGEYLETKLGGFSI